MYCSRSSCEVGRAEIADEGRCQQVLVDRHEVTNLIEGGTSNCTT